MTGVSARTDRPSEDRAASPLDAQPSRTTVGNRTEILQLFASRRQNHRLPRIDADAADDVAALADHLLDALIEDCRARNASDLHLEPASGRVMARGRVDGVLQPLALIEGELATALIRTLSSANPCSGESSPLTRRIEGSQVRLPLRVLGTAEGMRARIDLAPISAPSRSIALPGASQALRQRIDDLLQHPDGMILVVGPSGSGRGETLDQLGEHLRSAGRAVIRVGSPPAPGSVLPGLVHVAPDEASPSTLAATLSACAGQAPDAVLFDASPDRTLMERSLTLAQRLLVLARLDASDAIGALMQLRGLRIDPFLIAGSLRAVMAQRLVRRLCPHCRMPVQARPAISALLGFDPGAIVYQSEGCDQCGGTGYLGHAGAYELVTIDHALRRLITDGGDEAILARHAFLNSPNLGSAARTLVREGVTSAEEAVRLSRGESIPANPLSAVTAG